MVFSFRAKIRMRIVRGAADAGRAGKKLGASLGDHYDIVAFRKRIEQKRREHRHYISVSFKLRAHILNQTVFSIIFLFFFSIFKRK